uniref:Uncharacterized protein n=1 Tax=viral metagenome TaxID=1070528 RepID=A0A6C0BBL3_9ZZZZ
MQTCILTSKNYFFCEKTNIHKKYNIMSVFTASASANGSAYTNTNVLVTAVSSATATSEISQQDALEKAMMLAQQLANETAIYDANVINEATNISTDLANYNVTQIDSPPDITFYYSTDKNISAITKTNLYGNGSAESILQTLNGPVFSDAALTQKIGKYASTLTIYDINNTESKEIFERTGIITFYLPKGQITVLSNANTFKRSDGVYASIPGTYLQTILGGTDEYLNAWGIARRVLPINSTTWSAGIYLNQ